MSDEPKKTTEAAGEKKGSSSGSSKPNMHSLENSEPSSNPIALPALGRSSGTDKKIKTGPKAVLPGAVAQSTSASNGKLMPTQNTSIEIVSCKEGTKESNYHQRTITTPRFISGPIVATKERVSSSFADNNNISATTASLNNSEPSALPALMKSSKPNKLMAIGTNSVLPGAVADTAAPDEGFKGNKYQRKIAASSVNSKAMGNKKIGTNAALPGAVADTAAPDEGFKGNKYQRKIAASSVSSKATCYKKSSSSPNESAPNEVSPSVSGNFAYNEVVASTFASLENSEPSTFPEFIAANHCSNPSKGQQSSDAEALHKDATPESDHFASRFTSLENSEPSGFPDFLPDFIAGSHTSNTSNGQYSSDAEAHNKVSSPDSEHVPVEKPQDNERYISQDNYNTTDTQGLVVATLVESDKNILGTDVIVDAIVVNDKLTTWYKDRRTLLIVGIIVVVAVAISVSATVLLLGERNNESSVVESVAPSLFDSSTPARALSLNPSSSPSTMPSEPTTLSTSPRILKALYDSTDGPNWLSRWDFSSELSYCDFYGITCDNLDQITLIILVNNGLRGSLPSELGMLLSLRYLDLWLNSITGTIPSEIGMLSSLTRLDLDDNSITGTIPSEIGMLSLLDHFYLSGNSITGTIPSEIGTLSLLTVLELDVNSITGTIPSEIGMQSSLTELYFTSNSITGTIPSEIGMLSSLQRLGLDGNSITGTIPTELCALTNTEIDYDGFEILCTCIDSIYIEGTPCN